MGIVKVPTELPRYKCHKEVRALKIAAVGVSDTPAEPVAWLEFVDPDYSSARVTVDWVQKHAPHAGGYYVVYDDGYTSFSPAKAFEEGYERIDR